MTGFIMILHALICIILVVVILMQSGRGGGLTEGFGGAESMFGAHTNKVMIQATTVISTIFLVTCLGLAVLSTKSNQSLMPTKVAAPQLPEELIGDDVSAPQSDDKIILDELEKSLSDRKPMSAEDSGI